MSREAMQIALDALEANLGNWAAKTKAVEVLRQALKTEQEPVAWMTHTDDLIPLFHKTRASALNWQTQPTPLYTAPQKQWVGLTLNEAEDFYDKYTDRAELINAIDKFLMEKNHGH
jgi:pyruvate/2-oxoglutarate dehydrogenase complex dihydrolipoamide dehydrogenase (E3) component